MTYEFRLRDEPLELYPEFDINRELSTADFTEIWHGEVSRGSPDYVRWLQQSLNRLMGIRLAVDGLMGAQTRSAIRSFQQQNGLTVDGIAGSQTERALVAAGASSPPGMPSAPAPAPFPSPSAFRPTPVETPGGGRIQDKTPPFASDLVTVTGVGGKRIQLHRLAAQAWQALVQAARADGLREPLLLPGSGYRSPDLQKQLWDAALVKYGSAEEARKWVAPPGNSAHQTGRAIDFYLGGHNSSANVAQLRTLPAYRWMAANAQRFGFYPYEREPWHWEYNPPASRQFEAFPPSYEALEIQGEYEDEGIDITTELPDQEWESEVNRSSPNYIKWIQDSLNRILGLRLAVDGDLGSQTRSAIRSFQQQQGLIADGIVGTLTERALIAAGAQSPPSGGATSIPTPKPSWVQTLLPLLNKYRGDIPLDFLLGWIAVESNGRIATTTHMDERGYFQIHPGESKTLKLDHTRLSYDPDYSVQAGIQLVRYYGKRTQALGIRYGTDLFWGVSKLWHWLPLGVTTIAADMQEHGINLATWNDFRDYVLRNQQRLAELIRNKRRFKELPPKWHPKVGVDFVDRLFRRGRELAAGLANP